MPADETKIYYSLLIAAGVILLLFGMFLISVLYQYRKNRALYYQKLNAEITASENERKKLAGDLHDDIGPLLAAVRMQIRNGSTESLEKAVRYTDDVIQQIREVSHQLLPVSLDRAGLSAALKDYCEMIAAVGEMKLNVKIDDDIQLGKNDVHVYRIVHEIIHNAVKHSGATEMNVSIRKEKNQLLIHTKDNGVGTDLHTKKKKGLGLMNIAARVEMLQGDIFVESAPNKGVEYHVEIPIPETET